MIPPQNLNAEQALLGCCIVSDTAIDQASEIVTAEMFYSDVNAIVFRAVQSMRSQGKVIDALTVAEYLESTGELGDIGGMGRLHELMDSAPYIAHSPEYARPVRDCYRRRLAEAAGRECINLAHDMTTPIEEALAAAESTLHNAIAGGGSRSMKLVSSTLLAVLDDIDNPKPQRVIATGFSEIDTMLRGGMRPGNQIILAARPSVGKTALALCVCQNALRNLVGVLFASYEMTAAEVTERLIALVSGVNVEDFAKMRQAVQAAAREIDRMPLFIDDSQPNISQLCATIRVAARKGIRMVVVDYLQLVPAEDPRAVREVQVAGISRKLKQVGLSCGVTVIALSQLNRAVESRDNPRPRLSDLRESGAIEQDADIVAMLWRPNKDGGLDRGPDNIAHVDIAKNRNGRCGVLDLEWQPSIAKFSARDRWENA